MKMKMNKKIDAGVRRAALHEDVDRGAGEARPEALGLAVDDLAEARGALEGERGGHRAGHAGRGRALLFVVDEDAGDGEAGVAHEADELLELGVGLAGEPGDEGGADRGARQDGADAVQQGQVGGAVA